MSFKNQRGGEEGKSPSSGFNVLCCCHVCSANNAVCFLCSLVIVPNAISGAPATSKTAAIASNPRNASPYPLPAAIKAKTIAKKELIAPVSLHIPPVKELADRALRYSVSKLAINSNQESI